MEIFSFFFLFSIQIRRKRKGDGQPIAITDKRVKIEPEVICDICYGHFDTPKLRQAHYAKKHLVETATFGCSSCAEQYASEHQHRMHHESVHKKKRVVYTCPMCSTTVNYSLPKFNNHVASCVHPFYNAVDVVDNITCAKCNCQFETKNLYDWHGCFIDNKRPCPKCKRVFVKKATLWRHIFACDAVPDIKPDLIAASHMVHIPTTNISADSKRPKKGSALSIKLNENKNKTTEAEIGRGPKKMAAARRKDSTAPKKQISVSFKMEPETILDPVTELERILATDATAGSVHESIVSPVGSNGNEGDLFGFDATDTHFGDDGDSDSEAEQNAMINAADLPQCTVNLEMFDSTDFPAIKINSMNEPAEEEEEYAFDEGTHHGDDDFEDEVDQATYEATETNSQVPPVNEEAVSEASTSQAAEKRQPLTMRIKREVMHTGYGDAVFNSTLARNIKREKGSKGPPVQRTNARKSTAKPTYTIIHSNASSTVPAQQLFDPVLARNIKREKSAVIQPDNARKSTPPVSQPITENNSTELFDPVLARNIKREMNCDAPRLSARKSTAKPANAAHTATSSAPAFDPVLARNIKREKGTTQPVVEKASTSSISSPVDESGRQLFDPVLARNIKREKDGEKTQKSTLRPNPIAVASTSANVSKKMYKMALLAEKIRQERLAREAGEQAALSTEETSNSSTSSQNIIIQNHSGINDDTTSNNNSPPLPVISNVMDANNLEVLAPHSNELFPSFDRTAELAELIPFKPIRISTEFKKMELSAITSQPTVAEVVERAEIHTSEPEIPFTISKVVSLTSINPDESHLLEPDTNENQSGCGTGTTFADTNNENQDDGMFGNSDEKTPEMADLETEEADETSDESVSNEWTAKDTVAAANDRIDIQEKFNIGSSGHNSDSVSNNTPDFQSDKDNIMASLEAIEQIVTEMEKSDNQIIEQAAAAADSPAENANSVANNIDSVTQALPMDTVESYSFDEGDRIAQVGTEKVTSASKPSYLIENIDISRDIENAASELMDTLPVKIPNENDKKKLENQSADESEATKLIQNAADGDPMDGLDDISEDSLGFSDAV